MEIVKFKYEDKEIQFNAAKNSVMINATQMAKIFGTEVSGFLKTEQTKKFIKSYCHTEDLPYGDEFSSSGKLVKIIKGDSSVNGTWMERIVALKFAAWLSPEFELWVFQTIEKLLFDSYTKFIDAYKQTTEIKTEIKELSNRLRNNPDYIRLMQLKKQQRGISKTLKNFNSEDNLLF